MNLDSLPPKCQNGLTSKSLISEPEYTLCEIDLSLMGMYIHIYAPAFVGFLKYVLLKIHVCLAN